MSFTLQVRRAAELEIAEAQLWYETQQAGLGAEFRSEVSRTIEQLAGMPFAYQVVHRDIRRAVVRRFPYLVWFRAAAKTVIIVACTYAGRDPERVKARLR